MEELPAEAHAALALAPGESVTSAWSAFHRVGSITRSIQNFPDPMEGFLVLTTQRILFLQQAGSRFSRSFQAVPPLVWPLSSLADPISPPTRVGTGKDVWIIVQGEYFCADRGGAQETGRAQWALERARAAARAPAATARPIVPPPIVRSPGVAPAPRAPAPTPPVAASAPAPAAPTFTSSSTPAGPPSPSSGQGLSRPGAPMWPMVPMTLVETADSNSFWSIVGSSGVDRGKLLVFCTESPGEISSSYGLAGATLWRISSNEGEGRVRPGDVDRLGDLVSGHLDKESGQAVVLKGLDRVIEDAGFRSARKLLEVAREAAERTRGAVIIHADPVNIGTKELHQLEDDAKVLRL